MSSLSLGWVVVPLVAVSCSAEGAAPAATGVDNTTQVDGALADSAAPQGDAQVSDASVQQDGGAALPIGTPRNSANVFVTGHSLTDNPLADYLEEIAKATGTANVWNEQIGIGSPIRSRTRGADPNATTFPGYRTGKNRNGQNMDVVAELRAPQTIGAGAKYDVLLLTERHDLASVLQYEETVRYARHFHERLIAGNAEGTTYLYHSWLDVNKDSPTAWIAYERTAAPAWRCVSSRINASLAAEGRLDRTVVLPAGSALTELVEKAVQGIPGISGASTRATLSAIFSDNVHLTRLGVYFMSLVSYASIYRREPSVSWVPPEISAQQAQALKDIAWPFVQNFYATIGAEPTGAACRSHMVDTYCASFYSFTGRMDQANNCKNFFAAQSSANPLYLDPATDRSYWFPAP
jgi:hypothetical protein